MNSRTRYPLCPQIQAQQELYLQKKSGLFELFDKLQTFPLFSIPQNSIVVDLDNITFGPGRYSIRFQQQQDSFFKIMSYCILHFIFEKAYSHSNTQVYQRLLHYIFTHQIVLEDSLLNLTQEKIKIYLVKFLHLMESAKSKRKIVVEELNNLPQMTILLVALVKQVASYSEVRFQQNARNIESNIAASLGIQFDLLSCDLMLFGEEFQVQIRHFDQSCEFLVTHHTSEIIQKIKEDFYLAESAYFKNQEGRQRGSESSFLKKMKDVGPSSKLLKRETMRSIQWVESEDEDDDCFEPQATNQLQIKQLFRVNLANEKAKAELFQTQDQTVYDASTNLSFEKPKILNFNDIIKQATQVSTPDDLQTTNSTTFQSTNRSILLPSAILCHKPHKTSLQNNHTCSFSFLRNMSTSKSTRQIKTHRFELEKSRNKSKEKRVPSFILNRAKEKTAKQQITHLRGPAAVQYIPGKMPKITFIYVNK